MIAKQLKTGDKFKMNFVEGVMTALDVKVRTEGRFAGKVIVRLHDSAKGAQFTKYFDHNLPVFPVR